MTVFALKSTSTPSPNQILFPTLPLELREQIYHHVFLPHTSPTHPNRVTISATDTVYINGPRYPTYLPHLCRVNTSTRIEVGLRFIRDTQFVLLWPQYLVYLSQFLSTFPDKSGFGAVRGLAFEAFGRHIPSAHDDLKKNAYIVFMKKCPGLLAVTMKFEIYHLLRNWPKTTTTPLPISTPEIYKLLSAERLADIYKLHGIFECENLRTLHVEVWPRVYPVSIGAFFEYIPDCWPVMEGLVEWMRRGFEEREKKVDVRLTESENSGMWWAGGRAEGGGGRHLMIFSEVYCIS